MSNKNKKDLLIMKEFVRIIDEKLSQKNQTNLYQREVARQLNISNSTISRIIGGEVKDVKLSTFISLCKCANVTDEEILYLYHLAINDSSSFEETKTLKKDKLKFIEN